MPPCRVILDLTPRELQVLDAYEGKEYERVVVHPLLDDGTSVEAGVYVWKDEYRCDNIHAQ